MAKGLHHYVRETWKKPKEALPHMFRQTRMAQWRREPVNCRIERPTRLDAIRNYVSFFITNTKMYVFTFKFFF